jgi:signal peptidase I
MAPTLLPGDFVLVERLSYRFGEPARGDVVVFSTDAISHSDVRPNSFYIKRVAGLPGERIQIEPPNLLVNGDNVDTPPIMKNISSKTDGYEGFLLAHGNTRMKPVLTEPNDAVVLGEDEYFLLGDNTEHSLDSRYFGPVSGKSIIGRVTRIYYPFKRINELK